MIPGGLPHGCNMKKTDIDLILKENQSLRKRNQELENLLKKRESDRVPVFHEQIYRSLLRLCPASLIVSSLDDGVIYDVSDRFCRQSGYSREEAIGRSAVELGLWAVPDEERKKFRDMLLREGRFLNQEFRFRRRNGEVITGLCFAARVTIGKRRYAIALVMDITDRKQTEEALQESENRYRFLSEHMSDIAWITDMNLRTLYITPSIKNVLGFTPAERSRQSLEERMTPDSVSRVRKALARLRTLEEQGKRIAEKPLTLMLEFYHKDGSRRWLETVVQGFHNTGGDLTVVHGVSRDVTERKQAQDELHREQVFLQSVIDRMPGIFCIVDKQGRYLIWNRNYKEVTGFSDEEIRSMTVVDRKPATNRRVVMEKLRHAFEQETVSEEYGLLCKDGTVKDYFISTCRIRYDERPCLMFNGIDITEQKQAQKALRDLADELEEANKALRTLMLSRNEAQKEIEEKLRANISDLVMPYVEKIGRGIQEEPYRRYLSVLESNLREIVSPFVKNLQSLHKFLTPQEIQIADLIRKGMRTKEIAGLLHTSASTIGTHRNHIRKKLNLASEGVNLRSYLQSLQ